MDLLVKLGRIFSIIFILFSSISSLEISTGHCLPYSDETAIFEGQVLTIYPKENTIEVLILRINRQWSGSVHGQLLEGEEVLIDSSPLHNLDCPLPKFESGSILNFIIKPVEEKTQTGQRRVFIIPGGIIEKISSSSPVSPEESSIATTKEQKKDRITEVHDDYSPSSSRNNSDGDENPCRQHKCQPGAKCEVWNEVVSISQSETKSIPICVCPSLEELKLDGLCDATEKAVCASNGLIYKNDCHMLQTSCVEKLELKVLFSSINPNLEQCRHASENFKLQSLSLTKKQIYPNGCEINSCETFGYQEVICSENGTIFGNKCLLNMKSCQLYGVENKIKSKNLILCEDYRFKYEICPGGGICQEYAKCSKDTEDREYCSCSHIDCSNQWPDRVCGDDGETYLNRCHLIKTSCEKQVSIKMQHRGFCVKNPCSSHVCEWSGEICKVDGSTNQAYCDCEMSCPDVFIPVCGSNGVTYDSMCHLRRDSCLQKREIFINHSGMCRDNELCKQAGFDCRQNQICSAIKTPSNSQIMPSYSSIKCVCPECPRVLGDVNLLGGPVCGSDGESYANMCEFHSKSCKENANIKIQNLGRCDGCKNISCDFYATCRTNDRGQSFCICPTHCEPKYNPVCGSDQNTYDNECLLQSKSCTDQKLITVKHNGICKKCPAPCPFGQECIEGKCECRASCPSPFDSTEKFCGSDGKYYTSECELNRQACLTGTRIEIDTTDSACRKNSFDSMLSDSHLNFQAPISVCNCDKYGTFNEMCDSKGQCPCRQGHQGKLCTECKPTYWRSSFAEECKECKCDILGSITNLCDLNSGKCSCKSGFTGSKCNVCEHDPSLTTSKCSEVLEVYQSRKFEVRTGLMFKMPLKKFLRDESCIGLITINFDPSNVYNNNENINILQIIEPGDVTSRKIHSRFSLQMNNLGFIIARYGTSENPDIFYEAITQYPIPTDEVIPIKFGLTEHIVPWLQIGENGEEIFQLIIGNQVKSSSNLLSPMDLDRETIWIGNIKNPKLSSGNGFKGCVTKIAFENSLGIKYTLDMTQISRSNTKLKPVWTGIGPINSDNQPPSCFKEKVMTNQMQSSSVCDPNPCLNEGSCVTENNMDFSCTCQPGWTGNFCESKVAIVPFFNGVSSFISLKGPRGPQVLKSRRLDVDIDFLPGNKPGFIMAIVSEPDLKTGNIDGPYLFIYQKSESQLVIVLRSGQTKEARDPFSFNGYNPEDGHHLVLNILPNEWTNLLLIKKARILQVYLNRKFASGIKLTPSNYNRIPMGLRRRFTNFNLSKSRIYFGSFPLINVALPPLINIYESFWSGAIQRIRLNDAALVLAGKNSFDTSGELESWKDITQYQGSPCGYKTNECLTSITSDVCIPTLEVINEGTVINKAQCKCSTPLENSAKVSELLESASIKESFLKEQLSYESLMNIAEDQICESKKMSNDEPLIGNESVFDSGLAEETMMIQKISEDDQKGVHFDGTNVFIYSDLIRNQKETDIQLRMKTTSINGLIFIIFDEENYHDNRDILRTDFLLMAMRDGHIEVTLNLAKGSRNNNSLIRIQSERQVNDGLWHELYVVRDGGRISLLVDNYVVVGEIFNNHGLLITSDKFFFGGTSDYSFTVFPKEYQENFMGCFSQLDVEQRNVDLLLDPIRIIGPINKCP